MWGAGRRWGDPVPVAVGRLSRACTCAEAGRCSPHGGAPAPDEGGLGESCAEGGAGTGRHGAATPWSLLLREESRCRSVGCPGSKLVSFICR